MLEARRPYTHEQVKTLYPMLGEVECRIVADIEQRYRFWEIWPHLDYPKVHVWYARRAYTPMQPLAAGKIGDIPGEIVNWINQHSSQPPRWTGT